MVSTGGYLIRHTSASTVSAGASRGLLLVALGVFAGFAPVAAQESVRGAVHGLPPAVINGPTLVAPSPAPTPAAPEAVASAAGAPPVILYQGRLTDAGGAPHVGSASLVFSLYAEPVGGPALWNEAHPGVSLSDGAFGVLLGSINGFPVNAWNQGDRYFGISVDGQAELSPRLRLTSVPFALEADRVGGKRAADFEPLGAAAIAAAGVQSQLQGSDGNPPNQGSNQVHWNNLYGLPSTFADGQDDGASAHGQLSGLLENDHTQYVLGSVLQGTDGTPPNVGVNRVHWDILGGVPTPLVNGKIPRSWIEAGAVDSTRLSDGGIAARNLKPASITADRLAPGAVGSAQITDGSLPAAKLVPSSITGTQVQNGSLAGIDIQDESLTSSDIQNGSILGVDLTVGSVTGTQVQDGTLTGNDLQDGSVSGADLADDTIPAGKLQAGVVTAREIGTNVIVSATVVDSSLTAVDLRDPPGLAFKSIAGFVDTVETQTPKVITTLTLLAPAPGWVSISAATQVSLLHQQGGATTVKLGLSIDFSLPDSTAAIMVLPGELPTSFHQFPLQTQAVFPVAAAGSVTIYVLAQKGAQSRIPSLSNLRVQGAYFPRRY